MSIDTTALVDVKIEGTPRRMDGKLRTVWVMQRHFPSVQGLRVPFILASAVEGCPDTSKTIIEKVALNPPIDQRAFENPAAPHTRKALDYTPRRESVLSPTASAPPAADSQDAATPPK